MGIFDRNPSSGTVTTPISPATPAAGGGEANTASNVGTGAGTLVKAKVGVDIPVKTIKAGTNITVTNNADDVTIAASGGSGEVNTASNLGTGADGEGLVGTKSGVDLPFKRIKAGTNVTLTSETNDVKIDVASSGEANTASSLGTGSDGETLVGTKSGVDLPFKRIKAGTNVTLTSETNDILIDVASSVPTSVPTVKSVFIAGESFAANTTFAVYASANKVYKHNGSDANDAIIGFAQSTISVSALDPITVYQYGPMSLMGAETTTVGAAVFSGATAGSFSVSHQDNYNQVIAIGIETAKLFVCAGNIIPLHSIVENQFYLRYTNALKSFTPDFGGDYVDLLRFNSAKQLVFSLYPRNEATLSGAAIRMKQQTYAVDVVADSNFTFPSLPTTLNGISISADTTRVLLPFQTTSSENGVWYFSSATSTWKRTTDLDVNEALYSGLEVYAKSGGTLYGNTLWYLTTASPTIASAKAFTKETPIDWKESLTLDATDVTNQYKDLAFIILPNSLSLSISTTGLTYFEGVDYTLSTVGSVTRVTVVGASNLNAVFLNTAVLQVQYRY